MATPQSSSESIISAIDSLCDWLTEMPRTAQAVATRMGTIESEGSSAVYVKPASPAFSRIIISRDSDSANASPENTSYVELALAQPGAVTVAALKAKFGDYTEPPRIHFDAPAAIHFAVDRGAERPLTCLVVAKVDEGDGDVSDGTVEELGVRVDPR